MTLKLARLLSSLACAVLSASGTKVPRWIPGRYDTRRLPRSWRSRRALCSSVVIYEAYAVLHWHANITLDFSILYPHLMLGHVCY